MVKANMLLSMNVTLKRMKNKRRRKRVQNSKEKKAWVWKSIRMRVNWTKYSTKYLIELNHLRKTKRNSQLRSQEMTIKRS